ncbi:MAG: hypothetical protein HQM13_17580 [SAR324 cluster bacterium]|nr:hypothetical protein [SAR324 cluster bacterium]
MRSITKKRIVCTLGWLILFLGYTISVKAQFFGFSADGAIAYSATDQEISGGSFGLTHPIPFVPNIGGTGFFFERRNQGAEGMTLASKVSVTSGNIFYNIPVPFFTFSFGGGGGIMNTKTDIIQEFGRVETIEVNTPIGEGFIRLGLPFIHFFDFHIGYHFITTGDIKIVKDSKTKIVGVNDRVNLSGGLTTIGILIAL